MLTGLAALEQTDWTKLHHAYGRATDTPGHLRLLLNRDPESRDAAMRHLWSAIIHQGAPWTATGPAALVVAGLLSEPAIDQGEPIRARLLRFLVDVIEAPQLVGIDLPELKQMAAFDISPYVDAEDEDAIYEDDDAANAFHARSILGCIETKPVLMQVMLDGLTNDDPRVRSVAAMGAAALASTSAFRDHAEKLESQLFALVQGAENTDDKCTLILALGELGSWSAALLEDLSPAVRMCAALSPNLANAPAAIQVLITTLAQHAHEIDDWFKETPPQFAVRPRFAVVTRLVRQVADFDRLVDGAVAVAAITTKHCVDFEWGPLLAAAFSGGNGTIQTESQRRYLQALVENAQIWDPGYGNPLKWFRDAGLVYDRQACAKLLKAS